MVKKTYVQPVKGMRGPTGAPSPDEPPKSVLHDEGACGSWRIYGMNSSMDMKMMRHEDTGYAGNRTGYPRYWKGYQVWAGKNTICTGVKDSK